MGREEDVKIFKVRITCMNKRTFLLSQFFICNIVYTVNIRINHTQLPSYDELNHIFRSKETFRGLLLPLF
jgi:hypothetical protein